MKKGILALLLTALVGGSMNFALADSDEHRGYKGEYGERYHEKEDGKHCKKYGKYRVEYMRKKLDLNEQQVKQIASIREKYQPRFEMLREKIKTNKEKLRETKHAEKVDMGKLRALAQTQGDLKAQKIILRAEKRNEIHNVLTKDQLNKIKEMKSEHHKYYEHEEYEHSEKHS